jgi:O-antigen/teichoic acid export membrane protein
VTAYSKVKNVFKTGDIDFAQVIYHSAYAFLVLGIAIGLQFIFDLFLARSFGAEGAGIFYLSLSVLSIASLLSRLGLERSVIRFLSPLVNTEMWPQARGLMKTVMLFTSAAAGLMSVVLYMIAPILAENVFSDVMLTTYFRVFALAVLPFSLMYLSAGILKGMKLVKESLVVERVVVYLGGILSIFTLGMHFGLVGVLWGFTLSSCLAFLVGRVFIRQGMPKKLHFSVPFHKGRLFASSFPLLLVAFSNLLFGQVNVLALGALSSVGNVGLFNIALKVSMVMGLTLVGINSISAAKISELYSAGTDLKSLAGKIAALGFLLSVPVFILMISLPKFVLSLFGGDFIAASTALIILAVGQLLNVTTGSAGTILGMTGHEKTLAVIIGCSTLINALLSVFLIPAFGIVGASIAVALSMAASNITQLFFVKKYLNIWSLPFGVLVKWLKIGR